MKPLPKPVLDARTVYTTCISKARPAKSKARLKGLEDLVAAAAADYEQAAATAALHTLGHLKNQPDGDDEDATANKDLTSCYTSRMARKRSVGRTLYEQLLAAAKGLCPLCGHGYANTLDHNLPKATYPLLAVTPANLVPACLTCNHAKGEDAPASAAEQTLHPYFDDITSHAWLAARLTAPPEPGVFFYVDPHPDWTPILTARVKQHFRTFKLGKLYSAQVGTELAALNDYLRGKPYAAIVDELQHRAASHGNRNTWQAALYRALAASPWYVRSGYLNEWDD
ncbi:MULTISPECIES: HNH endonuclease [Streptomyces]|uniref:HNH endonuclease n=1 Tax=Streptomyces TaxID=1883 RepID=UPI0036321EC1